MRPRTKVADRGPATRIAPGEYVTSPTLRNLELFDARHIDNIIHKTIVKKSLKFAINIGYNMGIFYEKLRETLFDLKVRYPFNLKFRVLVGLSGMRRQFPIAKIFHPFRPTSRL
jgi:hypothetical protein